MAWLSQVETQFLRLRPNSLTEGLATVTSISTKQLGLARAMTCVAERAGIVVGLWRADRQRHISRPDEAIESARQLTAL